MDQSIRISRRRALLGLAAGSALIAAGMPALAKGNPPAPVTVAIAKHKAAMRTIHRLLRRFNTLESLPNRPLTPKVQVGNLIHWNAISERTKTPIILYSHAEISDYCERHCAPAFMQERQRAAVRLRYAGLHRDFTRQVRALARFDRASGLTALQREIDAAYRAEGEAEAVVLLALPTTEAEATAKAAYIKRSDLLSEWTECPVTYRAVMRGLCEVGGAK